MPIPGVTEAERGYLAGILDGEGCLNINVNREGWPRISVEVNMTTKGAVQWIANTFRVGHRYYVPPGKMAQREVFRIIVSDIQGILRLLDSAQPYLQVKWGEAQLFRIYAAIRSGMRKGGKRGYPLVDEHLARLSKLLKATSLEASYQEALDLCVYLRQAIEERKAAHPDEGGRGIQGAEEMGGESGAGGGG